MTPDELWKEAEQCCRVISARKSSRARQANALALAAAESGGCSPEDLSIETVYALGDVDAQLRTTSPVFWTRAGLGLRRGFRGNPLL